MDGLLIESDGDISEYGSMAKENIYQMYARLGGVGFFVKRDSWSHPQTIAKVVSVGGLTSGPLPGSPPYHSVGPKHRSPVVMAGICYQGAGPYLEELSCPGTYAYTHIDSPGAWSDANCSN